MKRLLALFIVSFIVLGNISEVSARSYGSSSSSRSSYSSSSRSSYSSKPSYNSSSRSSYNSSSKPSYSSKTINTSKSISAFKMVKTSDLSKNKSSNDIKIINTSKPINFKKTTTPYDYYFGKNKTKINNGITYYNPSFVSSYGFGSILKNEKIDNDEVCIQLRHGVSRYIVIYDFEDHKIEKAWLKKDKKYKKIHPQNWMIPQIQKKINNKDLSKYMSFYLLLGFFIFFQQAYSHLKRNMII